MRSFHVTNAKETTLDYTASRHYAQSLQFAQARGLHVVNVAITLVRDYLEWTLCQRTKLVDLTGRLAALGARLGVATKTHPTQPTEIKSMASTMTTFPHSIDEVVESKLAADPALSQQWNEVSMRFHHVFAKPEEAFRSVENDRMLIDQAGAQSTIAQITGEPEQFGALKGGTGSFASRAEKADRGRALANVSALADSVTDYLRRRGDEERRYRLEELAVRQQYTLEIPALSESARKMLERIRDAIDRNALPASLGYALADKGTKVQLDEFGKGVSRRFGEKTFLPLAASDVTGDAFRQVSAGMGNAQQVELRQAWPAMRIVQQVTAHERSVAALEASEAMRQIQSQGLLLK